MKGNELLDKMELIDPAFVEEAAHAGQSIGKKKIRQRVLWRIAAVACLCLLVGISALSVEVHAYQEAVRFFDENELSIEGLTRVEVKEIYRDITTESFSYAKTADVIRSCYLLKMPGADLTDTVSSSPADLEMLWNALHEKNSPGTPYRVRYEWNDRTGQIEYAYLEKRDGETTLWSVAFHKLDITSHLVLSDGVLVWGRIAYPQPGYKKSCWIAKLTGDGEILWKTDLESLSSDFSVEYIASVLEISDGSLAVFSVGDSHALLYTLLSQDGKTLHASRNKLENIGRVLGVTPFGNGYLVRILSNTLTQNSVVKLDQNGTLTDTFLYAGDDCSYFITDIAEFADKLYLSAYAVPKKSEDIRFNRGEIGDILHDIFQELNENLGLIDNDKLTEMLRENYTAVLLVCDLNDGIPQTFCSVRGATGGKLTVDHTLIWDVESITDSLFSPATSSFTIRWDSIVYRYHFDQKGNLIGQEKTEEIIVSRR